MNKQSLYAILTISLIPIGLFLIGIKMTVETKTPQHTPVQIVTDNVAYQQLAQAIAGKSGHVSLLSGGLTYANEKAIFKKAEVVITDSHQNQLLTQRRKMKLHSKILIASDVIKNQNYVNYWLSPDITVTTITRLSDLLSDLDPSNRNEYINNSQNLLAQTKSLSESIRTLKAKKDVHYIATNNAQQLFMSQLGYKSDISDVESASEIDFKTLEKRFQDKKISFVLTASQDQSQKDQHVVALARAAKIPIITCNQVLPSDQKIWQWQLTFVNQLRYALEPVESDK